MQVESGKVKRMRKVTVRLTEEEWGVLRAEAGQHGMSPAVTLALLDDGKIWVTIRTNPGTISTFYDNGDDLTRTSAT